MKMIHVYTDTVNPWKTKVFSWIHAKWLQQVKSVKDFVDTILDLTTTDHTNTYLEQIKRNRL